MYPNSRSATMRPPSPTNFVNFSPPSDYPTAMTASATMHHHHHHPHHYTNSTISAMPMKYHKNKILTNGGLVNSAPTGGGHSDLLFQDDTDCIEFFSNSNINNINNNNNNNNNNNFKSMASDIMTTDRRKHRSYNRRSNHKMEVEQQVKWTRKNIAATMERFEPASASSTALGTKYDYGATSSTVQQTGHVNHVYSYAYYEPGAAKCHTNIPPKEFLPTSSAAALAASCTPSTSSMASSSSSIIPIAGPSKSPPRNSIRALLAKSFRSKTLRKQTNPSSSSSPTSNERHAYTTRYGTTENLYEEVHDQKIRKVLSDNRIVATASPTVKEELRRVQHNHFRVLDELNLSLEALIMPPTPPDPSPTEGKVSHASSMENLSSTLNSIELKDHTCINPEFDEGDLDSGFSGSGSSSGASYNESLRYYKTNCNNGMVHQTTTLPHNVRSCRSSTASATSTSKSSVTSEDQNFVLPSTSGCGNNTLASPFNFVRRCSDSQRSSSSTSTTTGTKPKKNFWNLKQ